MPNALTVSAPAPVRGTLPARRSNPEPSVASSAIGERSNRPSRLTTVARSPRRHAWRGRVASRLSNASTLALSAGSHHSPPAMTEAIPPRLAAPVQCSESWKPPATTLMSCTAQPPTTTESARRPAPISGRSARLQPNANDSAGERVPRHDRSSPRARSRNLGSCAVPENSRSPETRPCNRSFAAIVSAGGPAYRSTIASNGSRLSATNSARIC